MKASLIMIFGWVVVGLLSASAEESSAPKWIPENTRLVVFSMAMFEGETPGNTSFSTWDRLDDPLVKLLIKRGVREDQILYLKDGESTKETITESFPLFLDESTEEETLICYFSSHGGYNPETGEHTFYTFNGPIPINWLINKIESHFHGSQAILFSDCCYSGGFVDLIESRTKSHISFGALSTTGSCNLAYSGWRFNDLLIRAWSGDVAMDTDSSKSVSFSELCAFAESYMAFVAEGKPLYATTGSFDDELVLSRTDRPAKEGIGNLVEAKNGDQWDKAEVVDVEMDENDEPSKMRVHFTDKSLYTKRIWVPVSQVREYEYPTYKVGAKVQIQNAAEEWLPGRVIDVFQNMHECSYDGKSELYNEWMSPARIRRRK